MTIENAIKTALDYEHKVKAVYDEAVGRATDDEGRRIFGILAREEQYHIDFLNKMLKQWKENGVVSPTKLKTTIPSAEKIAESIRNLHHKAKEKDYSDELLMLNKALDMEDQTMTFYQKLVDELDGEYQQLFADFLEIEINHKAIVQAEIDHLQGSGFWFDFPEFNLEVE